MSHPPVLADRLADDLGLERSFVDETIKKASSLYRTYQIPKRSGGKRTIHHPTPVLKALQRCLLETVFRPLRVHSAATAYERGASILKNAQLHMDSRFLLRMDFLDFFPSITSEDVIDYLSSRIVDLPDGWTQADTEVASSLSCRFGRLTIGSVTSPALTNRICLSLDDQLQLECRSAGVSYSRYADDLLFSTSRPDVLSSIENKVFSIVDDLACPRSLEINRAKTRHLSKKRRRVVTGLVLSSSGDVSIGRTLKRRIRTMVFRFESLSDKDQRWLRGMIAFCRGVEPDFVMRLYHKFGSARLDLIVVGQNASRPQAR